MSEFSHGLLEAENLARMFPAVVTEFMENPLLTFVAIAKDAAEKFYDIIKDSVVESAHDAENAWVEAQRLGVGVQWLSELQEAGKRVGLQTESLTTAVTYMNRSMVMALQGEKDQADAFNMLGLSTDFLKAHLNDTQGMFEAVFQRMQALPSVAEKTRVAFELLGRGGADMMPLFQMGAKGIDQAIASAHQFGAVIDASEIKSANAFIDLGAQVDEMWTGLKKQLATPILQYLASHTAEVHQMLIVFAGILRSMIPAAIDVAAEATIGFLKTLEVVGDVADRIAAATGRISQFHGISDASFLAQNRIHKALDEVHAAEAQAAHGGGSHTEEKQVFNTSVQAHVNVPFDPRAAASQVAAKIAPMMKDLHRKAQKDLAAQAAHAAVARATGGRR